MNSTDWLTPFLSATPWFAWFFLGLGIPFALWLLPRRDWRDTTMILAVALALGPVVGTTWLFILGTVATFSLAAAMGGTLILAGLASYGAYQRRTEPYDPTPLPTDGNRFPALQWTLLGLMVLAMFAMSWDTAFWPFLRYDTLWTFGYNPKIFMLTREIPSWIDYYPQLIPLTFTFGDLAWGEHNDYAARAAVPWFFAASVAAVYVLGWRGYQSRLTGLVAAAMWMLIPSVLVWSSSGDLEHPMTTYFSLATLFFVLAWREADHRSRYGVLSGIMLGSAMWTKPTSGAWVLGVGVVVVGMLVVAYRRHDWLWFRERFRLIVLVGVACAPLGGMWYIRNILAGHAWTNLPPSYWTDLAQRSGMQLVWGYVLAVAIGVYLLRRHWGDKRQMALTVVAIGMLSLAILPTLLSVPAGGWTHQTTWDWVNGFREPSRRMTALELGMVVAGLSLLLYTGRHAWQDVPLASRQMTLISTALGLPFFLVYFWSFSYHYRLGLTVLPLFLTVLAALLVTWLADFLQQNKVRQAGLVIVVVAWGVIAPLAATYHTLLNTFSEDGVRTTAEKYAYANPALMQTVSLLELFARNNPRPTYHILAPGENRLAFYFPEWDVDDEPLPTDIEDLADYDLFIPVFSETLWRNYNQLPNQVWAWTQLAHAYPADTNVPLVLTPLNEPIDDGNNRYIVYGVQVEAAYTLPEPTIALSDVVFGDTLQLVGYDISGEELRVGQPFRLMLYWRGTENAPPPNDYSIFIHFINPATGEIVRQLDGGVMNGLFPTRLFTPDLMVVDVRDWLVPADMPLGVVDVRVGVYIPNGPRLTVTQGGVVVGDGIVLQADMPVVGE